MLLEIFGGILVVMLMAMIGAVIAAVVTGLAFVCIKILRYKTGIKLF